jgi:hypothetical protein
MKITDKGVILNLLAGAHERGADVFVWRFFGNTKHIGQVKIEFVRKSKKDFSLTPIEGQDKQVHEIIHLQEFVDLYIPESLVLLRCDIKTAEPNRRYYLKLPDFMGQVERRKSFRLKVYDTSEVKVSFAKSVTLMKTLTQHFFKDCYDVSTGGFSFLVSKMELKFFQKEDKIEAVEIKLKNWVSKIPVFIRSIQEIEPDEFNGFPYKVWRINCSFVSLDLVSKKYLERFIFERIKSDLSAINE